MNHEQSAFSLALDLLLKGQNHVWDLILLSLYVSGLATLIASLAAGTLAGLLAVTAFPGKNSLLIILRTMTSLPAVVVGLLVYLALSRTGPLGVLGLIFTPTAMIIAQSLLLFPLIAVLGHDILAQRWRLIGDLLQAYGVGRWLCLRVLAFETRLLLLTLLMTAFGRAIAEVGAVMIVGGNIEGYTRVMTTAIDLETSQGNLPMALALGMVLLALALTINLMASLLSSPNRDKGKL